MLKRGKRFAVGSFAPVDMANVMITYSITATRVMKRRIAKRFFGVVQWNMRRFLRGVAISGFPFKECFVCSRDRRNINFAVSDVCLASKLIQ